jgi:hypothetical protein
LPGEFFVHGLAAGGKGIPDVLVKRCWVVLDKLLNEVELDVTRGPDRAVVGLTDFLTDANGGFHGCGISYSKELGEWGVDAPRWISSE